jgi:peptide chain release factor 3
VINPRLDSEIRLTRIYRFFGRDRETVPEAYPGDVVGLVNPGRLAIGDTLYAGRRVEFPPIPQFPAERFAYLRPTDMRHKKFDEAVRQLEEEGLIQVFIPRSGVRHPIVGVVGALQLDVVSARLESEYGIQCAVEPLSHVAARWPVPLDENPPELVLPSSGVLRAVDRRERPVLIFESTWELRYCTERNPAYRLADTM